jgi:hypothetical protein
MSAPLPYPWPHTLGRLASENEFVGIFPLMRRGLLLPPPKDGDGRFLWYRKHFDKARRLLAERRARRQGLR